uniref:Uncharacterized protein n=1 Tax=Chenopodium quinoa TaxID=63459 RepID=A0A803KQX0_CHEQI
MGRRTRNILLTLTLYATLLFTTSNAQDKTPLFVFGDSLYDGGMTLYNGVEGAGAEFWPYGMTYFKRPAGRYSDGRVIPDFLAQYVGLPFLRPYLQPGLEDFTQGINFASASACVLVETRPGTTIYSQGGRKFAFQNVGPIGCMPSMKSMLHYDGSCLEEPLELARMYNAEFAALANRLQYRLPGFKYTIYDFHTSLHIRVLNGNRFGFKESETACCGSGPFNGGFTCQKEGHSFSICSNPADYLWFDAGHTTDRANEQFASEFWLGGPNVVAPCNLQTFLAMS